MSPNSIKITAWEGVLGPCVLTEGDLAAFSHFLLVKYAMVKDERLDFRKSFPENILLCRPQLILWEEEFDDGENANRV